MGGGICPLVNPVGIPSFSPGLRGTSYLGLNYAIPSEFLHRAYSQKRRQEPVGRVPSRGENMRKPTASLTAALVAKKLASSKHSFDDNDETVEHVLIARAVAAAMRRTTDGRGGREHRQIHSAQPAAKSASRQDYFPRSLAGGHRFGRRHGQGPVRRPGRREGLSGQCAETDGPADHPGEDRAEAAFTSGPGARERQSLAYRGSRVWLAEKESFTVDEMLYALMVQSANDAAVALAEKVAGSTDGFIELMNRRAKELGMANTVFHSVHGLPPGKGQEHDVTTARDLSHPLPRAAQAQ